MIWTSVCLEGMCLCDILDLMDFVLWDVTGDFGRWRGRTGDRGGRLSSSSSMSGVRERPSESLKLFSLGMVVVVGVTRGWGMKISSSCSLLPLRQPRQQPPGVHQNLKGGVCHDRVPALAQFQRPQLRWLAMAQALYSYRP